jgi:hypothetical protein
MKDLGFNSKDGIADTIEWVDYGDHDNTLAHDGIHIARSHAQQNRSLQLNSGIIHNEEDTDDGEDNEEDEDEYKDEDDYPDIVMESLYDCEGEMSFLDVPQAGCDV